MRARGSVLAVDDGAAVAPRLATEADLPALRALVPLSVRGLSAGHYTSGQIESALHHVFGVDTQLIADGTYFVAETPAGQIVGGGGWSRRRTLFGGDQMKGTTLAPADDFLDPTADPARVRAFFVHPDWARRGIATSLLRACVEAARAAGYRDLTLGATLPGVAFYRRHGFVETRPLPAVLPDGTEIAFVEMSLKMTSLSPPEALFR